MTVPAPDGFDWNCRKYEANIKKHRIRFEVAVEAFDDPYAIEDFDSAQSAGEDRYWLIGNVQGTILHVSYSIEDGPEGDLVTRLISARAAEQSERHAYAIQAT